MIITLSTGEKIKVKETFDDVLKVMSGDSKTVALTVREVKVIQGAYDTVDVTEYYTLSHIVSYKDND